MPTARPESASVLSYPGEVGRPIRRMLCGYILTADQSYAGSAGLFSRRILTAGVWVYECLRVYECGWIDGGVKISHLDLLVHASQAVSGVFTEQGTNIAVTGTNNRRGEKIYP
eukprot:1179697-Prorocentrum_minimum.AAC.3